LKIKRLEFFLKKIYKKTIMFENIIISLCREKRNRIYPYHKRKFKIPQTKNTSKKETKQKAIRIININR